MQVDGDAELGDGRPEAGIARVVEVHDRLLIAHLGESVDKSTRHAKVGHGACQLGCGGVGILHGKRGEGGEPVGSAGDLHGGVIIETTRPVHCLPNFVQGLDSGCQQREYGLLDAALVHHPEPRLVNVEQHLPMFGPCSGGEVGRRLLDDVGVSRPEMLFEGNLVRDGHAAWWRVGLLTRQYK